MVTGATCSIGRAGALAYATQGAKVGICGGSTAEKPNKYLPGTVEDAKDALRAAGALALALAAEVRVHFNR